MSEDNIKVTVKVRPLIKREYDNKLTKQWRVNGNTIQHIEQPSEPFVFDHIFDEDARTKAIFDKIAKPIVIAALKGINGTIFAYGQTSSGKTHTMCGDNEEPGITMLAIREIFKEIDSSGSDRQFLLRIGYIEIYNEKIYDLCSESNAILKIQLMATGEAMVNNKQSIVSNAELMMEILQNGNKKRRTAGTNMNERSSRSHTIFTIIIESTVPYDEESDADDRIVKTSYLNLVDLAGSERADQSGATGHRLQEASNINKSLLSLTCVIHKLSENQSSDGFINYRDSKLTRLLQSSLGGNAMTAIICNITPAANEETYSTLSFGTSAKSIKNKPVVNEVLSGSAFMKKLQKEIQRLESELAQEKLKNDNDTKRARLQQQITEREAQFLTSSKRAKDVAKTRRQTWCSWSPLPDEKKMPPPQPSNIPRFIVTNMNSNTNTIINDNDDDQFADANTIFTDTNDENFPSNHRVIRSMSSISSQRGSNIALSPQSLTSIITTPKPRKQRSSIGSVSDKATIDNLEEELLELQEFSKLEAHIGPTSMMNQETLMLRSQLDSALELVEQYRTNVMTLKSLALDSTPRKPLQRKWLTPNTSMIKTESDVPHSCEQLISMELEYAEQKAACQSVTSELATANERLKVMAMELESTRKSAELAKMQENNVNFEFEHHKNRWKKREHELLQLIENPTSNLYLTHIAALKAQLMSAETTIAKHEQTIAMMNSDCRPDTLARIEIERLQSKIVELETERHDTFGTNEAQSALENAQQRINHLTNDRNRIHTDFEVLLSNNKELQSEFDELSQQLMDVLQENEELERLKQKLNETNDIVNMLRECNANLERINNEVKSQSATKMMVIEELRLQVHALNTENETLRMNDEALKEGATQIDEFRQTATALKLVVCNLSDENEQLVALRHQHELTIEQLRLDVINMQTEAQQTSVARESETADLQSRNEQLTERNRQLSDKLANIEPFKARNDILESRMYEMEQKHGLELREAIERHTRAENERSMTLDLLRADNAAMLTKLSHVLDIIWQHENGQRERPHIEDLDGSRFVEAVGNCTLEILTDLVELRAEHHKLQQEMCDLVQRCDTVELHYDAQVLALRTNMNAIDDQLVALAQCKEFAEQLAVSNDRAHGLEEHCHKLISDKEDDQKILESIIAKNLDLEERIAALLESSGLTKSVNRLLVADEFMLWLQEQESMLSDAQIVQHKDELRWNFDLLKHVERLHGINETIEKSASFLLSCRLPLGDRSMAPDEKEVLDKCIDIEAQLKWNKTMQNHSQQEADLVPEKTELCADIQRAHQAIQETENEFKAMRQSHSDCLSRIAALQKENESLQQDRALTSQCQKDAIAEHANLAHRIEEQLRTMEAAHKQQLDDIGNELSLLQVGYDGEKCRLLHVEQQLAQANEERASLATKLRETQDIVAQKTSRIEEITLSSDSFKKQLAEGKEYTDSLNKLLEELRCDVAHSRSKSSIVEKAEQHSETLKVTLQQREEVIEYLTEKVAKADELAALLSCEREDVKSQLNEAEKEARLLEDFVEKMRLQSDEMSIEMKVMADTLAASERDVTMANRKLQETIASTVPLEKLNELTQSNADLQCQLNLANEQCSEMLLLKKELECNLATSGIQINELTYSMKKLQCDLNDSQKQLTKSQADRLRFQQAESALQSKLEKESVRCLELNKCLDALQQKYDAAKKHMGVKQAEIDEWKEKVQNAAAKEVAALRSQCKERDDNIGLLSYSLESMRAELTAADQRAALHLAELRLALQHNEQFVSLGADNAKLTDQLKEQQLQNQQQTKDFDLILKQKTDEYIGQLQEAEIKLHKIDDKLQQKCAQEMQYQETQLITCQQRCVELQTHSDRLTALLAETERKHMVRAMKLTQELEEAQKRLRSEHSFNEKEMKINELEHCLKTIKTEEIVRRKQLLGENNELLTKNQQLASEIEDLRGKVQKDRKSRRHSTHDETRMSLFSQRFELDTYAVATQTGDTDSPCGCLEMDAKIKLLERELKIKECQVGAMNIKLENHPLRSENAELHKEIRKYDLELHKQQMEIHTLVSQARDVVTKTECTVCAARRHRITVDRDQQTDTAPAKVINMSSYNGSALITEEQNSHLRRELGELRHKYDTMKKLCQFRAKEIEKLKQQSASSYDNPEIDKLKRLIDEMEEEITVLQAKYDETKKLLQLPTGSASEQLSNLMDELKTKNISLTQLQRDHDALTNEFKTLRLKYENTKILYVAKNQQFKELQSQSANFGQQSVAASCSSYGNPEIDRLRGIIDEMEEEITELQNKYDQALQMKSPSSFDAKQSTQLMNELTSTKASLVELRLDHEKLNNELSTLRIKYEDTCRLCNAKTRRLNEMESQIFQSTMK